MLETFKDFLKINPDFFACTKSGIENGDLEEISACGNLEFVLAALVLTLLCELFRKKPYVNIALFSLPPLLFIFFYLPAYGKVLVNGIFMFMFFGFESILLFNLRKQALELKFLKFFYWLPSFTVVVLLGLVCSYGVSKDDVSHILIFLWGTGMLAFNAFLFGLVPKLSRLFKKNPGPL
ncbi:MAG: hypothetical protein ACKOAD_06310 [Gammaproteobacteria bacterium]